MTTAIVGAGELGGAIASTLAGRGRVRAIRLIDEAAAPARGKALDVWQASPVLGSDTRVTGHASLDEVERADVVVLADAFGAREWQGEPGLALLRRIAQRLPSTPLVLAGAMQAWLIERAVAELGLPWSRVIGSAAGALAAGARTLVALEADASPLEVCVEVTGVPPDRLVVAWEAASIAGAPLAARLDAPARARVAARLPLLWPPGPAALASAAAAIVEALAHASHRAHPAFVAAGPARASAAPRVVVSAVHLVSSGVSRATMPALSAHEQVALENALSR